jgi:hypothetical protein
MAPEVPTLYEWLGGPEPLNAFITRSRQKVPADPVLELIFCTLHYGYRPLRPSGLIHRRSPRRAR